jgi:hypothetical protein
MTAPPIPPPHAGEGVSRVNTIGPSPSQWFLEFLRLIFGTG